MPAPNTVGAVSSPPAYPSIVAGAAAAVAALAFLESTTDAWRWLFGMWMSSPDYSHGVFVPPFAAGLFWQRWSHRGGAPLKVTGAACGMGVLLIGLAGLSTCAGIYCRMMTLEALAIVVFLGGIALCCGGWRGALLAAPSVLFLLFMIPLPRDVGMLLAGSLQEIATWGSTYAMQTLGLPAVAEGQIISLSRTTLGVADACSGIRMLMSFFALATAVALIARRSLLEKIVLVLSAPAIAILVNILRIAATGIAYEYGDQRFAELILHDLAGWLMMPAGLLIVWVEWLLLARVFPAESDDDVPLTPRRPAPVALSAPELRRLNHQA